MCLVWKTELYFCRGAHRWPQMTETKWNFFWYVTKSIDQKFEWQVSPGYLSTWLQFEDHRANLPRLMIFLRAYNSLWGRPRLRAVIGSHSLCWREFRKRRTLPHTTNTTTPRIATCLNIREAKNVSFISDGWWCFPSLVQLAWCWLHTQAWYCNRECKWEVHVAAQLADDRECGAWWVWA